MRKLFIILGLISAIIATILSVLPLSNLAFIPAIVAFVFGLLAFRANKEGQPKHTIQLIFLLTIISLALATYKTIFNSAEVGNTEQLEQRETKSLEESKSELEDLEIEDDLEIDVNELEIE